MLQPYSRTSHGQPFTKDGIPIDESVFHQFVREKERFRKTIHRERQGDYQFCCVQFEEGEVLPERLTYDEALERAYK